MIEEIKIDRLEELIQEMMKKIRDTYPTESREGNPIAFDNGAAAPLVKCVTAITGYQSGSGTPSSENIRPITGYTKNDISVTGKNIWVQPYDITKPEDYTGGWSGTTIDGEWIKQTGYPSNVGGYGGTVIYNVKKGTYTVSFEIDMSQSHDSCQIVIQGKKVDSTSQVIYNGSWTNENFTNTFTVEDDFTRLFIRVTGIGTDTSQIVKYKNIQLECGGSSTPYVPYIAPTTYSTTFTSPIYKGTEDVVSGKVTAEWGYIASYDGETLPGLWISDRDEYAAGTTPTTGAQVAYELESPTTISETVSNAPVSSIHGYNTIQSSTGDMEVTYITEEFEALANVPTES